jgi:hypothetical protein
LLVGNNVDKNWLFDASLVVNCKIGNIVSHFFYLDLSIDGNLADLLGCHWLRGFGRGCLGVKVDIIDGWSSSVAQIYSVFAVGLLFFPFSRLPHV